MTRFIFLLSAFILPWGLSDALAKKEQWPGNILSANPKSALPERKLASVKEEREANKALFERIQPGDTFILQNSIEGLNDEEVSVTEKFENGSVKVRFNNGRTAFIRGYNLSKVLSPEVNCGRSHGVEICKGDQVFHPIRSSSLQLPEGKVTRIFGNGTVAVTDGAIFYLNLNQVGKSVDCSPQKETICKGDYVIADAYKNGVRVTVEGQVGKVYTNGIALVNTGGPWRFPIEATALTKRVSSLKEEQNPAVISSSREFTLKEGQKDPFGQVTPEIIPFGESNSKDAQ